MHMAGFGIKEQSKKVRQLKMIENANLPTAATLLASDNAQMPRRNECVFCQKEHPRPGINLGTPRFIARRTDHYTTCSNLVYEVYSSSLGEGNIPAAKASSLLILAFQVVTNKAILMLAALLAVVAARPASKEESEYDYEEDVQEAAPPPPPPKAVGGRLSLLNSRTARGPSPLVSGRGAKAQQVTSKAPEPAPEVAEEVVYDDEPLEGEEVSEDVTTTTETPKKNLIRGGVRPFRSNDDLLAALKRRRQQMNFLSPVEDTVMGQE
uniref:Uncharacterized protein n=1 Tax=Timema genevievae TaxID=629358 RepID=A0A7R9K126_TIMGE|nr:unnamed protein product [Timema genevievae]